MENDYDLQSLLGAGADTRPIDGRNTAALDGRLRLVGELLAKAAPGFTAPALIYREPRQQVRAQSIANQLTMGRDKDCTISIPDRQEISRKHFEIVSQDGHFVLKDETSRNGTKVNGSVTRRRELLNGDLIEAGGVVFVFVAE